jgi:hypothetical protein
MEDGSATLWGWGGSSIPPICDTAQQYEQISLVASVSAWMDRGRTYGGERVAAVYEAQLLLSIGAP